MKLKFFILFIILVILFSSGPLFYLKYHYSKIDLETKTARIKNIIELVNNKKVPLERFQFGSFSGYLDTDFFEQIRTALKKEKLDFILVNLSSKKLFFYKNGEVKNAYKVLTIGKEGSFWETPAGFYEIESKNENLFSSMGNVYMPYSLNFQGNFFIHGWPYYPSGQPVSSKFSGGCIRLSTEDAASLFKKVKIGTPVLIVEDQFSRENSLYKLKRPQLSAESFLAIDLKNNFVFASKNIYSAHPIASITKLVTALAATEYINLWKTVTFKKGDQIFTSKPRLKIGQKYNGFDLLYPLLTESSNEAALTIADFLGKERFVKIMNKKAKSVGMLDSKFVDPYGGSAENQSTLKDLFQLAKYLYFNRQFILNITKGKKYNYLMSRNFPKLENFNCFANDKDFIGGKIGQTKAAGETMLAIFEIDFNNQKRPIFIAVLHSQDACKEVSLLKNWLKNNFSFQQ